MKVSKKTYGILCLIELVLIVGGFVGIMITKDLRWFFLIAPAFCLDQMMHGPRRTRIIEERID